MLLFFVSFSDFFCAVSALLQDPIRLVSLLIFVSPGMSFLPALSMGSPRCESLRDGLMCDFQVNSSFFQPPVNRLSPHGLDPPAGAHFLCMIYRSGAASFRYTPTRNDAAHWADLDWSFSFLFAFDETA